MTSQSPQDKRRSAKLHSPGSVFGVRDKSRSTRGSRLLTTHSERITYNTSRTESQDLNGLQDLIGKKWYIFRVSPLYRFQNDSRMLRSYSRKLREYLTDMKTDSEEAFHYSVVFSEAPGITQTEHDASAFKLQVSAVSEENERKLYVGFMMCRGAEQSLSAADMIHLPVLFCRGRIKVIKSVHQVLKKCFDCSISPLNMTQEELLWCYAIQCEWQSTNRRNSTVDMTFTVPHITVKNSYSVKLPVSWLSKLWAALHRNEEDCIHYEEIKQFQECLGAYLSFCGLNCGGANLIKVATPSLTVTHEGHIRVTVLEVMDQVLTFLYDMSTVLESATPCLSVYVTR